MKFELGQVVATPGAVALMEQHNVTPAFFLDKHSAGDWGVLSDHDRMANEIALTDGGRILSSYPAGDEKIWVVTESDRSATTLLLPSEY